MWPVSAERFPGCQRVLADAVTHDMLYVVYPTVPPSIELAPELAMEKKNNLVLGNNE